MSRVCRATACLGQRATATALFMIYERCAAHNTLFFGFLKYLVRCGSSIVFYHGTCRASLSVSRHHSTLISLSQLSSLVLGRISHALIGHSITLSMPCIFITRCHTSHLRFYGACKRTSDPIGPCDPIISDRVLPIARRTEPTALARPPPMSTRGTLLGQRLRTRPL